MGTLLSLASLSVWALAYWPRASADPQRLAPLPPGPAPPAVHRPAGSGVGLQMNAHQGPHLNSWQPWGE